MYGKSGKNKNAKAASRDVKSLYPSNGGTKIGFSELGNKLDYKIGSAKLK